VDHKSALLHLTNGNSIAAQKAARVSQNTSRACARRSKRPLWYFASPHFASPGLAAQAPIQAGKTSVT